VILRVDQSALAKLSMLAISMSVRCDFGLGLLRRRCALARSMVVKSRHCFGLSAFVYQVSPFTCR